MKLVTLEEVLWKLAAGEPHDVAWIPVLVRGIKQRNDRIEELKLKLDERDHKLATTKMPAQPLDGSDVSNVHISKMRNFPVLAFRQAANKLGLDESLAKATHAKLAENIKKDRDFKIGKTCMSCAYFGFNKPMWRILEEVARARGLGPIEP